MSLSGYLWAQTSPGLSVALFTVKGRIKIQVKSSRLYCITAIHNTCHNTFHSVKKIQLRSIKFISIMVKSNSNKFHSNSAAEICI